MNDDRRKSLIDQFTRNLDKVAAENWNKENISQSDWHWAYFAMASAASAAHKLAVYSEVEKPNE